MVFDDNTDLYSWLNLSTITASSFISLTDSPSSYTSADVGKLITVNPTYDGVIFKSFTPNNVLFAGVNGEVSENAGFYYEYNLDTVTITDADGISTDRTIQLNPFRSVFSRYENSLARIISEVHIESNLIRVKDEFNSAAIQISSGALGIGAGTGGASLTLVGTGGPLTASTAVGVGDPLGTIYFQDNLAISGAIRGYKAGSFLTYIDIITGSSLGGNIAMRLDELKNIFLYGYLSTRDDSATTTPVNFLYTNSTGKVLSAPVTAIPSAPNGLVVGIRTVTTDYTVVALTDEVIIADASANSVRVTLPDATTVTKRTFTIKAFDTTNPIIIDTSAGFIDGLTTYTEFDENNHSVTLVSDGSNYYII